VAPAPPLPAPSPAPALPPPGKFHDQGDARWIVIRGQVRGHNDTPVGRKTPAGLSAALGLAALKAY
jgi:hypothetical protein